MNLVPTSECMVIRHTDRGAELLLGLKKRGIGEGKLVAPGGHVEPGETDLQACVREVKEETGLAVDVGDLRPLGRVVFRFPSRPEWDMYVAMFACERYEGEPAESDELTPAWYLLNDLPFERMWDDAKYWLPRVLAGEQLNAEITLNADCETVAEARFE